MFTENLNLKKQEISNMTEHKKKRGSWKPGQSGNPAGRKPGAGEVAKIRAAISDRVPKLLAKALQGGVGAARLLLERAVAPLKAAEQSESISLSDGSLIDQGRCRAEFRGRWTACSGTG
jgi:hypothetical protein